MPDYATQFPPDNMPVIDGGWLLHFIRLKNNAAYSDVLGQCSSFLGTKYEMCCVLFDEYEYDSTKYHEHKLRQTGKVSASIICDSRKCTSPQRSTSIRFTEPEVNCFNSSFIFFFFIFFRISHQGSRKRISIYFVKHFIYLAPTSCMSSFTTSKNLLFGLPQISLMV